MEMGEGPEPSGPQQTEQLNCPLVGMKCHDYNVPERKCDWFVPMMLPHPTLVGQMVQTMACKLDVISKMVAQGNLLTAQIVMMMQQGKGIPTKLSRDDILGIGKG